MDRVLMHQGEPQIYGTQYLQVRNGVLELWTVRDPSGLDQRRAALGLEPEAANRARLLAAKGLTGKHQDDERATDGRPAHHGPSPCHCAVPHTAPPMWSPAGLALPVASGRHDGEFCSCAE
jgi:hypothetical protein